MITAIDAGRQLDASEIPRLYQFLDQPFPMVTRTEPSAQELESLYRSLQLGLASTVILGDWWWRHTPAELRKPLDKSVVFHRNSAVLNFLLHAVTTYWVDVPLNNRVELIIKFIQTCGEQSVFDATGHMFRERGVNNPDKRMQWWRSKKIQQDAKQIAQNLWYSQGHGEHTHRQPSQTPTMVLNTTVNLKVGHENDKTTQKRPFPLPLSSRVTLGQVIFDGQKTIVTQQKIDNPPQATPELSPSQLVTSLLRMIAGDLVGQQLKYQTQLKQRSQPLYVTTDIDDLPPKSRVLLVDRFPLSYTHSGSIAEINQTLSDVELEAALAEFQNLSTILSDQSILKGFHNYRDVKKMPDIYWPSFDLPNPIGRWRYPEQMYQQHFLDLHHASDLDLSSAD